MKQVKVTTTVKGRKVICGCFHCVGAVLKPALNKGTPKTLHEAIADGATNGMHAAVRDFLAQRFSAAIFTAPTPDESGRLEQLFKLIVGENQ